MVKLDIVVEINVKVFGVDFRCDMSSLHRLDHGFDELLLGFGEAVLGVELTIDVGNRL